MKRVSLVALFLLGGTVWADSVDIEAGLRRALDAMAARRVQGGWAMVYTPDDAIHWGEWRPIDKEWITVQPPATPTVAGVFLRAGRILQDEAVLEVARGARDALLSIRTEAGGFPYEAGPAALEPPRVASFDDNVTTGALDFLIDWWQHTHAPEDMEAVKAAGDFLLLAQYPDSGGWPQLYPPHSGTYHRHITFNDGVMMRVIRSLLRLHEVTGEEKYLDGARKAGACILRLQGRAGRGHLGPTVRP